ncbi:MAG TPA: biotin--[acetyl-CoA-carboxylase] ligase [Steroidobacteraceae bacterium]|nr:biotin--[acetyl-CoA-carboxylase] ligase [Steroidobacteraceae bacterium]
MVLLADGELRSGEWLARELDVSRAAVWKAVERLRAIGVDVTASARRGYRLPCAIELLDAAVIERQIAPERRAALRRMELLFEVDSTNTRLFQAPAPPPNSADACITELQHAGRGRRGRRWVAPFGGSLAMSVGFTFADAPRGLSALSLAVGVAVARALERAGARDLALKWPNDIWLGERKAGGVLIELKAEASGPVHVVIGVGLNVSLREGHRGEIERGGARVAAVADACRVAPSRNAIAGAVLDELLTMLGQFGQGGFAAFRGGWDALDALEGRAVQVVLADSAISGIARGVDEDGALLVETQAGVRRFVSGEASLRVIEGGA